MAARLAHVLCRFFRAQKPALQSAFSGSKSLFGPKHRPGASVSAPLLRQLLCGRFWSGMFLSLPLPSPSPPAPIPAAAPLWLVAGDPSPIARWPSSSRRVTRTWGIVKKRVAPASDHGENLRSPAGPAAAAGRCARWRNSQTSRRSRARSPAAQRGSLGQTEGSAPAPPEPPLTDSRCRAASGRAAARGRGAPRRAGVHGSSAAWAHKTTPSRTD